MKGDEDEYGSFEKWRDRLFSVAVPLFLGYLIYGDYQDGELSTMGGFLVILLAGFAAGIGGEVIRRYLPTKGDK